jgi:hypothetical protein
MDVLIIGNFDITQKTITAQFSKTGTWYEYFTGEEKNITNTSTAIVLKPGEYKLFSTVKLLDPRGGTANDDSDGDGVVDTQDLCPNTPEGTTVNTTGCPSFTLPATNFSLTSVSETCPGKNNGQLTITAQETHTYVATINGATHNFVNNNLSLSNLQPGNYNVCITVTGQTYEQCYTVTIAAGTTVSAKATVTNTAKVAIQMEQGTAPYTVFVNDTMILQTSTPSFAVAAKHGDLIEVKTAVDCEGVFSKTVDLLELSTVYPNPTSGAFEITLPVVDKEIKIAMYNTYGQLISQKTYPVISGKVQLSIDQQPAGLYLAKVYAEKPFTLKIVKK